MPYLKVFTAPKDSYDDYLFWRMWHQQKALLVMLGAATWAICRWMF